MRMIRGSQTVSDTVLKHDLYELVIAEVRTAITNGGTGGSKPSKERFQEFANNSSVIGGECFCFDPFRQVNNSHDITRFHQVVGITVDCGPIKSGVKHLFGGVVRAMVSPGGFIVASLENVNGFLAVNTSLDDLICIDFEQEGRNITLIEAARTMLADAILPVTFWAEVVKTACYVQNRVLVNKSYNKTPYELSNGRSPAIGFLKPFGCHVMILNTLDNLGKFKEKRDEGYFIGYSMSSKAFRVFNKRTRRVEENLHVEFLENKDIEKGAGPNWLFDIDSLTKSMNYVPVDGGTISTNLSGTKDAVSQEVKKDVSSLRYIALPNWAYDALLEFSSMETPIPTVSSPVPTAYSTDSQEPSSDARLISKRVANQVETPSFDNILSLINRFKDILGMDVKSAFFYGTIDEEVYVMQPPRFQDPKSPAKVYKVEKAMYGLHQDPRAWQRECHLHAVKRIFRYLKGHLKLGLWYPKESPFDLVAYSDSDYGGATQDHKSTTGGCQFLGRRLISWQCKKQTIVATSTTKAEYVAAASCCGQVM
nr:ribonuclease H-like domain-containing protein [Tanacetum cinerariifolium]